jgi:protein SCO1
MRRRYVCSSLSVVVALAGSFLLTPAHAQLDDRPVQTAGVKPDLLRDVGLDQRLGETIPLDLTFRDEHGHSVALREFFGQKPVILTLVYYQCPMLCTEVLNGLLRSAKELPLEIGKDFSIVTVSIDPSERPILANVKHELYTGLYGRPGAPQGWHFLTGDAPQIKGLAQAVGFRYAYDSATGQFAHPSGIMLLTPQGKLARYFYGISFPVRDLRLGLVEASQEKIGSPIDQILLYCYHYDPATGKYGLLISRVIKLAAALTILSLGLVIAILFRRERYSLPRPQV